MSYHLEFTDGRFVFAKRSFNSIPLLVGNGNQFIAPVCDYLRYLVIYRHLKTSSAKTYADQLGDFWSYLEASGVDFRLVTDRHLLVWLGDQDANGVGGSTRAARCDRVFDFYVWCETNGYVREMVRIPGFNDTDRFVPRLASRERKSSRSSHHFAKGGLVSAVRPTRIRQKLQNTPTAAEITELHIAAEGESGAGLWDRNHLLLDWYREVGLRRLEWRALTIDQIPLWADIDSCRLKGDSFELRLTETKGDRPRYVGVLPELMERTREYIEGPREDIIARFAKKLCSAYRKPKEVFLSDKTGQALALMSITNLLTRWFKIAGVDAHGHRIRASYLTSLFEAELEAELLRIARSGGDKIAIDYEQILRKVAERAGHADINSLRSYLTLAKKRQARRSANVDHVVLSQQLDAKKQQLAILERQVARLKVQLPER